MKLAEQWRGIEASLPRDWADARLRLTVGEDADAARATALLGPLMPGRLGKEIRFFVARRGAGPGLEAARRLLRRLDEEGIQGTLELLGAAETAAAAAPAAPVSLADSWDAALAALPEDWSDLYAELELTSSDHLERGALLMAPVNPARYGGTPGFRFRVAHKFGYGASPRMARQCLARLDADGIPGELRILRVLSDTHPVATQGPVWYVGGKTV